MVTFLELLAANDVKILPLKLHKSLYKVDENETKELLKKGLLRLQAYDQTAASANGFDPTNIFKAVLSSTEKGFVGGLIHRRHISRLLYFIHRFGH
ncbi:hypothetical protein QVD17_36803 [Tagetes erecta]|uniref:Uncharacterized protein n=1 Tax=Tagetes erecta TaxID=13708 RepID=A0AAD8NJI1_TARER|nr:hypothetical protein QVD17_36803 [Tagetes erecta]